MKRPIIIDTDPGIDDVAAITAALFSDKLDVKLITTVGGNVGIDNTTKNALDLLTFLEKDIPVAKGCGEPLINKIKTASQVHGDSGVGNYQFEKEPNTSLLLKGNAIVELRKAIMSAEEPVTLVPIGPLTNIALLFKTFPETKENIKEIVLMGGAAEGGNATPVAEFNIYADPHAAKIVFDTSINIVMCGLDVTRLTGVAADDVEKVKTQGKIGEMIAHMIQFYERAYSKYSIAIHDLCTILYLTRPELFKTKRANVNVVTEGEASGCTVTHFTEEGNVHVCIDADVEAFRKAFTSIFAGI
ncbi:nucleoside hydrolase [Virgibacillus alimentarius]|uniref:Non-specific riboncleoside hydrolase n=1 Tax=Virgibacillus alimentarius TaxID=698769 RepID=A0ABS4SBP1_9BACI|nr:MULTISPECIES: nucleoside hydrolase [Virgibacillus]MBP2257812.1 non-specific riboncleoside hydrolase [Virgibacillus alimentarius]HLR67675.1 nucleoside hydrolase [Virgibacillus sp.]